MSCCFHFWNLGFLLVSLPRPPFHKEVFSFKQSQLFISQPSTSDPDMILPDHHILAPTPPPSAMPLLCSFLFLPFPSFFFPLGIELETMFTCKSQLLGSYVFPFSETGSLCVNLASFHLGFLRSSWNYSFTQLFEAVFVKLYNILNTLCCSCCSYQLVSETLNYLAHGQEPIPVPYPVVFPNTIVYMVPCKFPTLFISLDLLSSSVLSSNSVTS